MTCSKECEIKNKANRLSTKCNVHLKVGYGRWLFMAICLPMNIMCTNMQYKPKEAHNSSQMEIQMKCKKEILNRDSWFEGEIICVSSEQSFIP